MVQRSIAKSPADEDGQMLMARIWRFHVFTLLGKAKKLLKLLLVKDTTNRKVQLSTIQQAYFKATTVTKDFSKCHATVDVHFLSELCVELAVFKATTVTKSSQNAT